MCPLGAGLAQVVVHVGGEDDGLVVHIKGVHHVVGLRIQLNVFLISFIHMSKQGGKGK